MRVKVVHVITVMALFLLASCSKTKLDFEIESNPVGGYQVESVYCSFGGALSGWGDAITVKVEWWWENGFGYNDQLLKTEQYTFNSKSWTTYMTSYSAPEGYYLLNYFWVKFKWTDDDGNHVVESDKAYCYGLVSDKLNVSIDPLNIKKFKSPSSK